MADTDLFPQYLAAFYVSIHYWNKKNISYFMRFHYNGLMDRILSPIEDLYMDSEILRVVVRPIFDLVNIIADRYCKLFMDKQTIHKWISDGINSSEFKANNKYPKSMLCIGQIMDFEKLYKDFARGINEFAQNLNDYRRVLSMFLKTTIIKCYQCGKTCNETLKLCSECRMVYYCSKKCQKIHWNGKHRNKCKQLKRTRKKYIKNRTNDNVFTHDLLQRR
eukprot:265395_1